MKKSCLAMLFGAGLILTGCADDPVVPGSESEIVGGELEDAGDSDNGGNVAGFFVLNEGNMGSNKCTLDYYNYATHTYHRNIYAENNPNQVLELGDSGNDIAVYDNYVYIVLTGSNKVEVLDAWTAKRIGQVEVGSPRCLAFYNGNAYVSSYVGGENGKGSVVRFNAKNLEITGNCPVGNQPEEMVIDNGKLYVANSYQIDGVWDNTISVIDVPTFTVAGVIDGAVNMHHLRLDEFGNMWASSRGNYADVPSSLTSFIKKGDTFSKANTYNDACSNLAIRDKEIYFYGVTYDAYWTPTYSYIKGGIDKDGKLSKGGSFITDGTEKDIQTPYAIAIQPANADILLTDVKNYTSSGELRCYSNAGKLKWKVKTGDIPGHIAFLMYN